MSDEIKIMSATGIVGYGFHKSSFEKGLKLDPDLIGADGGSIDYGPYYLGSGTCLCPRPAVKRDIEIMLFGAIEKEIPMIIGTAGGSGGEPHLQWTRDIVEEIAQEHQLHFTMALIHAEQEKEYLNEKLTQGKISPLGPVNELTRSEIENTCRVVAMMGSEPLIQALEAGAEVIIAGRCSDSAIFAALPIMKGFPPGLSWHLSKIIECGGAILTPKIGQDCVFATLRDNYFLIKPTNPNKRCMRIRIAAHTLYENPNPYLLHEPSGTLDTRNCKYKQYDESTVKVSGSAFLPAHHYAVKLEGVKKQGYRTIFIAGIRDPVLIGQISSYLEMVKQKVQEEIKSQGISKEQYGLKFRIYGKNGVMGDSEPKKQVTAHELGIIGEVISKVEEISRMVLAKAHYYTLHSDFPGRLCIAGNLAFPYSPSDIKMGAAYNFNINHLLELDDACEIFPMEIIEL